VTALHSPDAFSQWQAEAKRALKPGARMIALCGDTCCGTFGSHGVAEAFKEELSRNGLADSVPLKVTGCHGFCETGPVVVVHPNEFFYPSVRPEDVPEIVERSVVHGEPVERLLHVHPSTRERILRKQDMPVYAKQQRVLFRMSAEVDPLCLEDYVARDGYSAAVKALTAMTPDEVIDEVEAAGLRGRGGAGFPTARKWRLCREAEGDTKYLICNADEGDPGAFMDRSLLESTPHAILEGMLIAAYAIGAAHGIIYVRAEYPKAAGNAEAAILQAREAGLLGRDILGCGFDFDIETMKGAGAYVCGEETALIASLEGRRGVPCPRPPFPAVSGYRGRPTNINNVETLANVPVILLNGRDWYRSIGTEGSKGTKVFALAGKVRNTRLVEVPMGTTLREIIYDIGGGIPDGREFKAAQMGGPSGGCVPAEYLDLPIDYDSVKPIGAIMGSGGLIIADETICMVDLARYFAEFVQRESCGKCVPCRIGTRRILEILDRITAGLGEPDDVPKLRELGEGIQRASLCGLGQAAPNPVLSTLRHFGDEYDAHIADRRCPAGSCDALEQGGGR